MEKHLTLCVYARDRSHDLELLFFFYIKYLITLVSYSCFAFEFWGD